MRRDSESEKNIATAKAARAMAIPAVALPHGVFLYTNDIVQTGSKKAGQFDRYNHFDYVIVQNRLFKETIARSGVPEDKISVLGSARYCKEWMDQNNKILPRKIQTVDDNSGKLKVIFYDHPASLPDRCRKNA